MRRLFDGSSGGETEREGERTMSEPRYLEGDDYALNGVEGEEEDAGDTGLPDRMWEDEE